MPTNNNTDHDADYYVGPPPSPAEANRLAELAMVLGAAAATTLYFSGDDRGALETASYLLTLLAFGYGFVVLRNLREGARTVADWWRTTSASVGGGFSDSACGPLPTVSKPKLIKSQGTDQCPALWPAGWYLTFSVPGDPSTVYQSAPIPPGTTHAALHGSADDKADFIISHSIAFS